MYEDTRYWAEQHAALAGYKTVWWQFNVAYVNHTFDSGVTTQIEFLILLGN